METNTVHKRVSERAYKNGDVQRDDHDFLTFSLKSKQLEY